MKTLDFEKKRKCASSFMNEEMKAITLQKPYGIYRYKPYDILICQHHAYLYFWNKLNT